MNQNTLAVFLVIIVGILLLLGAIFKWDILLQSKTMQKVESKHGENRVRLLYAIIGILVLMMGVYLYISRKLEHYDDGAVLIHF